MEFMLEQQGALDRVPEGGAGELVGLPQPVQPVGKGPDKHGAQDAGQVVGEDAPGGGGVPAQHQRPGAHKKQGDRRPGQGAPGQGAPPVKGTHRAGQAGAGAVGQHHQHDGQGAHKIQPRVAAGGLDGPVVHCGCLLFRALPTKNALSRTAQGGQKLPVVPPEFGHRPALFPGNGGGRRAISCPRTGVPSHRAIGGLAPPVPSLKPRPRGTVLRYRLLQATLSSFRPGVKRGILPPF